MHKYFFDLTTITLTVTIFYINIVMHFINVFHGHAACAAGQEMEKIGHNSISWYKLGGMALVM